MTEQEWLTSPRPWEMIEAVDWRRSGAADRKLRLFACACCRQVWNPFLPPFVLRAVTAAEAFADGAIGPEALAEVREAVSRATQDAYREDRRRGTGYLSRVLEGCTSVCGRLGAAEIARDVCHATARAAADVPLFRTEGGDRAPEYTAELGAQADLLRDIFENPWRPRRVRPEWLTSTVVGLARGIYVGRAFDRMPILADALQDAGCEDGILDHCREPRGHVRGCWVVDLLLGK
jgi:hypothetical protein